jgi:ornithine carbamoyltransferase
MRVNSLSGRSLLSVNDLSSPEFQAIIDLSIRIKKSLKANLFSLEKEGTVVPLIFQKPSTRTRLSLEVACRLLKAHPIYLGWNEMQLSRGEPIADTIRVVERMASCVVARVNSHLDLVTMKQVSKIPVVNALSDKEHPLQILADFMTLKEKRGSFENLTIAYIGDGNNVSNSLILGAAKVGATIRVATPESLKPDIEIVAAAKVEAEKTKGEVQLMTNPQKAVEGANVVYTDVWVSMGQESESSKKIDLLRSYQVNDTLLSLAQQEAFVMHCLPAHRGQEITDSIISGPHSIVFDQAENRLYTAMAVLYSIL